MGVMIQHPIQLKERNKSILNKSSKIALIISRREVQIFIIEKIFAYKI